MKRLFMDTETSGLLPKGSKWWEDTEPYPYICSIAWSIYNDNKLLKEVYYLIEPYREDGNEIEIHEKAIETHGLTVPYLKDNGISPKKVLDEYLNDCEQCDLIVGHNSNKYDIQLVIANAIRFGLSGTEGDDRRAYLAQNNEKRFDTMLDEKVKKFVGIPSKYPKFGMYKWPTLTELYQSCFGESFNAHNAKDDVKALVECYFYLLDNNIIK